MIRFPDALELTATSLVVIAPHPDDDVLGCGALIARMASRIPVRVVYVTDGAASHHSASYPPSRLRDVREAEARRALRHLGVTTAPTFLRWPDGCVPFAGDPAAAPLLGALGRLIPPTEAAAVAIPWRRDPHGDHRATASLGERVLRERPRAARFEYAVWLGIIGEAADEPTAGEGRPVEIDSRPWLMKKSAALHEHRSQLGELVTDATWAFTIPDALVARALGPVERFVIPVAAA